MKVATCGAFKALSSSPHLGSIPPNSASYFSPCIISHLATGRIEKNIQPPTKTDTKWTIWKIWSIHYLCTCTHRSKWSISKHVWNIFCLIGKNNKLTLIYFHDVPASTYENITHGELVVKKLIFYNILDKKYIIVYEYTIKKKPKK